MTWFENKDSLFNALQANAHEIGVDADNIIYGGRAQMTPCINIHINSAQADAPMLSTGHRVAGKMEVNIIVTVPGSMTDDETQDEAMKIAIEVMKSMPRGFYFEQIQPVHFFDTKGNIADTCAMSVQMYVLYSV